MPISSPSYFPPQRTTDRVVGLNAGLRQTGDRVFLAGLNGGTDSTISDLIVIGDSSASVAWTDAALQGSVVIGSLSLPQNINATTDMGLNVAVASVINIGYDNFPNMAVSSRMSGLIAIGSQIGFSFTNTAGDNFSRNILIGTNIWRNQGFGNGYGSQDNVIMGYAACKGLNGNQVQFGRNVIIGANAQQSQGGPAASLFDNVIIGANAGSVNNGANAQPASNVIIGSSAASSLQGGLFTGGKNNVLVGAATDVVAGDNNVIVGQGSTLGSGFRNVMIGAANTGIVGSGANNIIIGYNAQNGIGVNLSNLFIVGESDGGTNRMMFYGDLSTGNLVIGNSTTGTNRDFAGAGATNIVKLLNGTAGGSSPVGGGYFYVAAGVLHWVDSGGVDTRLSLAVSGQLASSSVSYTNNAAAQAGTLTNAPAAGNPTKWIPINDNGTVRNIPAW